MKEFLDDSTKPRMIGDRLAAKSTEEREEDYCDG